MECENSSRTWGIGTKLIRQYVLGKNLSFWTSMIYLRYVWSKSTLVQTSKSKKELVIFELGTTRRKSDWGLHKRRGRAVVYGSACSRTCVVCPKSSTLDFVPFHSLISCSAPLSVEEKGSQWGRRAVSEIRSCASRSLRLTYWEYGEVRVLGDCYWSDLSISHPPELSLSFD